MAGMGEWLTELTCGVSFERHIGMTRRVLAASAVPSMVCHMCCMTVDFPNCLAPRIYAKAFDQMDDIWVLGIM